MKLSDIGERALVEIARKTFKRGPPVRVGIGDDAAVIDLDHKYLVATTDMIIESTNFPVGTKPEQIGRKAVVVNLSDLAAMGAEPLGLIFSVSLPRELDVMFIKRLMKSMDREARKYKTYVVGGDLDESNEIMISGAAFGLAKRNQLLKRSEVKKGDVVAVTGELGAASAGLKILQKKLSDPKYKKLVKAQLEPIARVKEGITLARSGSVKAATDITDGLASSLWQVACESEVKIMIEKGKIPVHPLVKKFSRQRGFNLDDFVLFGGEDFELLFTVRSSAWDKVRRMLERAGISVSPIGKAIKGSGVYIRDNEKIEVLKNLGYEHFSGTHR